MLPCVGVRQARGVSLLAPVVLGEAVGPGGWVREANCELALRTLLLWFVCSKERVFLSQVQRSSPGRRKC